MCHIRVKPRDSRLFLELQTRRIPRPIKHNIPGPACSVMALVRVRFSLGQSSAMLRSFMRRAI